MKSVYDPTQAKHEPGFFLVRGVTKPSAEQSERAVRLLAALADCGLSPDLPEDHGSAARAAVHTPRYLEFLETAYDQWQALPDSADEVVANIFNNPYKENYPGGIVGRAGWHMADTACPIGEHTWQSACASANTAATAAQYIIEGEPAAYALCRPPGHHAYADMAGGFCFLNNAAIAVEQLKTRFSRAVVLDIDVHHGNGTQGIFYHRSDVMTISTHTDPDNFYPFHCGYSSERGEGDGEGYNINIPLPALSDGNTLLKAIAVARQQIEDFGAEVIVVALGLDTAEDDPLRGMSVATPEFEQIGSVIASIGLPVLYVQEGGYLCDALQANLASFLRGAMKQ